jgi:pyridinium-3,5-bisthiocarboxylic acid mononucleotide nickel chelatase
MSRERHVHGDEGDGHFRTHVDGDGPTQAHVDGDRHSHSHGHAEHGYDHGHHDQEPQDGPPCTHPPAAHEHQAQHASLEPRDSDGARVSHVEPGVKEHAHHHAAVGSGFRSRAVPAGWRLDQPAGFGAGKLLYFDAFSGIAGDMTVAALVDLGVPQAVVEEAIAATRMTGYSLRFLHGTVSSIGALRFEVDVGDGQNERNFARIDAMIEQARLDESVRRTARAIFRRLAEAEATVHRTSLDSVHFHEVGAVDSIADIVGAAACIEYIGATVWVSPLPMGRGFVKCRHGIMPLPAPATVGCLTGIITRDAGIDAELVTPTGAAIVSTVAKRCSEWPRISPVAIGWGAGTNELPDRPNLLRVVLGESDELSQAGDAGGHVIIEANLDDATGELTGHALGLLIEGGALDAWAVPVTMKKGRPGIVLSAIVSPGDEARLTALLIRETTTLGVRRHAAGRTVRPRRMIEVETRYGRIPIKVSEGPFGPPQAKPEFDRCVRAAQETGVPVREVIAEAMGAARCALGLGCDSAGKP